MIEDVIKVHSRPFGVATAYTYERDSTKSILRFANVFELELNQKFCELIVFSFSLSWPQFEPLSSP